MDGRSIFSFIKASKQFSVNSSSVRSARRTVSCVSARQARIVWVLSRPLARSHTRKRASLAKRIGQNEKLKRQLQRHNEANADADADADAKAQADAKSTANRTIPSNTRSHTDTHRLTSNRDFVAYIQTHTHTHILELSIVFAIENLREQRAQLQTIHSTSCCWPLSRMREPTEGRARERVLNIVKGASLTARASNSSSGVESGECAHALRIVIALQRFTTLYRAQM